MSFPTPRDGPLLVLGENDLGDVAEAGWQIRAEGNLRAEDLEAHDQWGLNGIAVCTADTALAILVIARSGCAIFTGDADEQDRVFDDARRLHANIWRRSPERPSPNGRPGGPIDDTTALLEHLAAGASVGAAARGANMSLRTAQRRLATLRNRYGVPTTAGAVAAWAREQRT